MAVTKTNNGKRGGMLSGKPHYKKDGSPAGGIKAVVTDSGGKPVELEGGEVIINKEASKKHWKELSRINQSAGGGVPILPPDGADEDPEEFKDGGNVIRFNPNDIPKKYVIEFALKIKKNYPEIWKMGGNIFGNEAFENLYRVYKRGMWLDKEEWMYIKWKSFIARHKDNFKIEGVVAMLKWCGIVSKGWNYMRDLVEAQAGKRLTKSKRRERIIEKKESGGEIAPVIKTPEITTIDWAKSVEDIGNFDQLPESTQNLIMSANKIYSRGFDYLLGYDSEDKVLWMAEGDWWDEEDLELHNKFNPDLRAGFNIQKITNWKTGSEYKMQKGGLLKGIKVESEHEDLYNELKRKMQLQGSEMPISKEDFFKKIASRHLKETPKYYDLLLEHVEKKEKGGSLTQFKIDTPTGIPSKLTYLQQILVRTSAFKQWFGDWEAAARKYFMADKSNFDLAFSGVSKVIDFETMEPRLVFHGTRVEKEFYTFDIGRERQMGRPYAYFAHNKAYSENFAAQSQRGEHSGKGFIYECFLNIRNPLMANGHAFADKYRDAEGWMFSIASQMIFQKYGTIEMNSITNEYEKVLRSQIYDYIKNTIGDEKLNFWVLMARDKQMDFKYFLISHGYDGIYYTEQISENYDIKNPAEYTFAITVFNQNEIKLGDGRNLYFNNKTDDIRYEDGGNVAPVESNVVLAKERLAGQLFGSNMMQKGGSIEQAVHPIEIKMDAKTYVEDLIKKMKS